jgi:hypothetical protein
MFVWLTVGSVNLCLMIGIELLLADMLNFFGKLIRIE